MEGWQIVRAKRNFPGNLRVLRSPFDDKAFKKFDSALDGLATLPQEKIVQYSDVKRALLQRHLWKVFDTTFGWDW